MGAFNGEGQNKKFDTDDDFDLATRLEVRPFGDYNLLFSANTIYSPTNREHSGPSDVSTVGDAFTRFLDYDANNRGLGSRQRAGAGFRGSWGGLEIKSEANLDYHREVVSAAGAKADLLSGSYCLDVSYLLTGESFKQGYDGAKVKPTSPLYDSKTKAYGPGAFQLSLRFEDFYADPSAVKRGFATGSDRATAGTTSLHWYMWESVRFSVSYTYTHFEDGVRDSSGRRHIDENALMTRLAMYF